mmetsp:Transcript_28969/g.67087  ORF Transcript_28969/g.67087 Transcript_28969/m.67087 type:complete len:208 (-) Transcript_28969:128-751(-)
MLARSARLLSQGSRVARMSTSSDWHSTTVLCVRKDNKVVMVADGQVSLGNTVMKPNARKVRRLGPGCIGGFAGSSADGFTLFERLESKLQEYPDQLLRACVELAKDWRTDKYLRKLEAMMLVADKDVTLTLTGNGDVLEPFQGVMGIGSGGLYAQAAAIALLDMNISAEEIAYKSMNIAADMCVYTNKNFMIERIPDDRSPLITPSK